MLEYVKIWSSLKLAHSYSLTIRRRKHYSKREEKYIHVTELVATRNSYINVKT
jgi:hypothetical protein